MGTRFGTLLGIVLLAFSALLLVGCGGESAYVGQWEIDKEAFKAEAEKAMKEEGGENNPMAGFAMAMIESMSMSLDIKSDHTFTSSVIMMGQNDTQSGTWKKDGNGIVMTNAGGDSPGKLVLKGGKLHAETDKKSDEPPFVLKRKKS